MFYDMSAKKYKKKLKNCRQGCLTSGFDTSSSLTQKKFQIFGILEHVIIFSSRFQFPGNVLTLEQQIKKYFFGVWPGAFKNKKKFQYFRNIQKVEVTL